MTTNLLANPGFEADWGDEKSHRCLICVPGAPPVEAERGNIFTPPGWLTWFVHKPGTWDQPEVTDMHAAQYPERVHSGTRGMRFFTFDRCHDGGFMQQVAVEPGLSVLLTAWAHAWSNNPLPGHEDCTGNGLCSAGVGEGPFYLTTDETPGDPRPGVSTGDSWADAVPNFTFWVGIDPTGGTDPTADSVEWGCGAHIYNVFAKVPAVAVDAKSDTVTVFLRSRTKWLFRNNDAYWDDVELTVVEPEPEPKPPRGAPREQYERTVVLLPPAADADWARAAVDAVWDDKRYTIGGSADDAGIGDLDVRRIIAVNPGWWAAADEQSLADWFAEHYPGVEFVPVVAITPALLGDALRGL